MTHTALLIHRDIQKGREFEDRDGEAGSAISSNETNADATIRDNTQNDSRKMSQPTSREF